MTYVFCLDERMGMAFMGKRQSRDRKLIEDFVSYALGKSIFIFPYSESLFENIENVTVVSSVPAEGDGFLFLENIKPESLDGADGIIIYNWMRHYPSDLVFDLDLSEFELESEMTFEGFSHPEITRKAYKRK
ncbi:MAG: hypothetical protein IJ323_01360 [Clostridia bacterium]|nr:hypothetical protein [Clostridia bacterium]